MEDLLDEYKELLHEPEGFEIPEYTLTDGTVLYIEDTPADNCRIIYARRRLVFTKGQLQEAREFAASLMMTDETFNDIYDSSLYKVYNDRLKAPLDKVVEKESNEMAESGWRYTPPIFEMGTFDPRSFSSVKYTEIHADGMRAGDNTETLYGK